MEAFIAAVGITFLVIFIAELGDKSQLMALTFTIRYRPAVVLTGVVVAIVATQTMSVAIGHGLGAALPGDWTSLLAGAAFLAFAGWTLREARKQPEPTGEAETGGGGAASERTRLLTRLPVLAVAGTIFAAELGDKTMLATITLASQHGWLGTWVGSVLGMLAVNALGILVGGWLRTRLPTRLLRYASAGLFAVVGCWLVVDGLRQLT